MEGDPKYPASQDDPRLPVRALRASWSACAASASSARTTSAAAWDEALAADRPAVLEAVVDREVPPLPPHITFEQAKKFAEAMLKGDPERGRRDASSRCGQMLDELLPGR